MSSDSEIDGIERFQSARERELSTKAGLDSASYDQHDVSDEEVMAIEDEEGQDQYYEQAAKDEDDDERWGDTRDNYFGGEDDLGAEDGASEEEEEEALRLQHKQLAEMEDADFVDEDDLDGWKQQATEADLETVEETRIVDMSSMTVEQRRELIEAKFPAILLLSNELEKCNSWERDLTADSSLDVRQREAGIAMLRTYAGMIYSFFALFSERVKQGDTKGLTELEEHPVHEGILTARQLWQDFQEARARSANVASTAVLEAKRPRESVKSFVASVAVPEPADGGSDSSVAIDEDFEEGSEYSSSDDDEFSIAKPNAKPAKHQQQWKVVGDYDETADTVEQQQRAKNKQSLRFYTSQIDKNDALKGSENTGDMDVPYREREFERRQRLMQEAQRRGQEPNDRLGEDDEEDEQLNEDNENVEIGEAATNKETAYTKMKQERAAVKERRRKDYADAKEAARAGRFAQYVAENPNVDKRAINYQIEKNKGLTPKRRKENRNARVKKRMRYEAAQKKIKGVRKVYEEQHGPYGGELTGIRKNLVHSNKFKN